MNASIYIFGELSGGYTQYPQDNMQTVFQTLHSHASAKTQIVVHRDRDMMYYGYIRKLDNTAQSYIGLCFSLNGLLLTDYAKLFDFFEKSITSLVVNGDIVEFKENGNVISHLSHLYDRQGDVDNAISMMYANLQQLESTSQKLPPVSFGVNKDEVKCLPSDSDKKDIVAASHTYSNTIVLKSSDYDDAALSSYRGKLKKLYDEKEDLSNRYNKLLRQKKQFKMVLSLLAVLLIGGVCIIYLFDSLDKQVSENYSLSMSNTSLKNDLTNLNGRIDMQSHSIRNLENSLLVASQTIDSLGSQNDELLSDNVSLNGRISVLSTELTSYKNLYSTANNEKKKAIADMKQAQQNLDKLNAVLKSISPIVINKIDVTSVGNSYGNAIYAPKSMYLKARINYTGMSSDLINLTIKWYTPDGVFNGQTSFKGFKMTSSFYPLNGANNSYELPIWGCSYGAFKKWQSGSYRVEIWYGDVCLKSKDFTVY